MVMLSSYRGQQGTKLPVDEAILHAIRKCNKIGRLFVFTERAEAIGYVMLFGNKIIVIL